MKERDIGIREGERRIEMHYEWLRRLSDAIDAGWDVRAFDGEDQHGVADAIRAAAERLDFLEGTAPLDEEGGA